MTVPGGPLFVCVALGSNGGVDALGLMGLSGAGFWVQVWNGTSLGCRTCRTCSLAADSSHTETTTAETPTPRLKAAFVLRNQRNGPVCLEGRASSPCPLRTEL